MALHNSLSEYFVYTRFVLAKRSMAIAAPDSRSSRDEGDSGGEGYELDEWTVEARAGGKRRSGRERSARSGRSVMVKGRLRD